MRKIFMGMLLVSGCAAILIVILTKRPTRIIRTKNYDQELYIQKLKVIESLEVVEKLNVDRDGMNIFFHETSSFGGNATGLNPRQACAVESAAKMNPEMTVYLLLLAPSQLSDYSKYMAMQLLQYDNVRIKRIDIEEYVMNTPLEDWNTRSVVRKSQWPTSHMSDVLRYLTLWKFGGMYLDLDVVIITNLQNLTNFVGAEDEKTLNSAVMGFSSTGFGKAVAEECLENLKSNFHGDIWGNNGPGVITRVLKQICHVTSVDKMTPDRCQGFRIFPPAVFYPIHYTNWRQYFAEKSSSETMHILEQARAIHVWNKFSSQEKVSYGSNVPYALIAKQFCPKIYNNCGSTF